MNLVHFKRQEFSGRYLMSVKVDSFGLITAVRDFDGAWVFKGRFEYMDYDQKKIDAVFEKEFQTLVDASFVLDKCELCKQYLESGICMSCDKNYEERRSARS